MPPTVLSTTELGNIINFGCALVSSELAVGYEDLENDLVCGSLLALLGASKHEEPDVIAQITEETFEDYLQNWWIPLPGAVAPAQVVGEQAQAPPSRLATPVERARAKLAWGYCRQVTGLGLPQQPVVQTGPVSDPQFAFQLGQQQQVIAQLQAQIAALQPFPPPVAGPQGGVQGTNPTTPLVAERRVKLKELTDQPSEEEAPLFTDV